ncbi:MAG: hypothetical protein ACYDCI_05705 [Candidatus Limnocylindrales bacterium]
MAAPPRRSSRLRFAASVTAEAAVLLVGILAVLLACTIVLPGTGS